jgi:hypothetical protein
MNRIEVLRAGAIVILLVACAAALGASYRVGDLAVRDPWSRATPPGTPMGAGYMEIVNEGDRPDRLIGARSPAAREVQLHLSIEEDGTTRMERQRDGVLVPAGASVVFAPGGYHLMLMGLHERLRDGERVPVTLEFAQAGTIEVELAVRPLAGGGGHSDH